MQARRIRERHNPQHESQGGSKAAGKQKRGGLQQAALKRPPPPKSLDMTDEWEHMFGDLSKPLPTYPLLPLVMLQGKLPCSLVSDVISLLYCNLAQISWCSTTSCTGTGLNALESISCRCTHAIFLAIDSGENISAVPVRDPTGLGRWCSKQRISEKANKMTQNHRHQLKSVVTFEFDGMAAMAQRVGCALPSAVPRPFVETSRSNSYSYRDVIQGASKGNEDISDEDEPFCRTP